MLIRITNIQVPRYWELIKFSALNSDRIKPEYQESYCINLLYDLLNNKKVCYYAKKDSKIAIIYLIHFFKSVKTGELALSIDNMYTFAYLSKSDLQKIREDTYNIAKRKGCKAIVGETENEKLYKILKTVGIDSTSWKYTYYV